MLNFIIGIFSLYQAGPNDDTLIVFPHRMNVNYEDGQKVALHMYRVKSLFKIITYLRIRPKEKFKGNE